MGLREHLVQHLHINITDESKAYGYTLVIWGSGAVLTSTFGFPGPVTVLLYVLGAVIGFGLLSLLVYHSVFSSIANIHDEELVVASMVHFIAALGTIAITALIAQAFTEDWAFFLSGINASLSYNLLMLPEVLLSEEIAGKHHA